MKCWCLLAVVGPENTRQPHQCATVDETTRDQTNLFFSEAGPHQPDFFRIHYVGWCGTGAPALAGKKRTLASCHLARPQTLIGATLIDLISNGSGSVGMYIWWLWHGKR
jgi:hypothetical protein